MPTRSGQSPDQIERFNAACRASDLPMAISRQGDDLSLHDGSQNHVVEQSRYPKVIVFLGLARALRRFGVDLMADVARPEKA